jgi:phosphate starvation-inducible PhoH-like protein
MPSEIAIPLKDPHLALRWVGQNEQNLRTVETALGIQAVLRGDRLVLSGDEPSIEIGRRLFEELEAWQDAGVLSTTDLHYALEVLRKDPAMSLHDLYARTLITTHRGKPVRARTLNQRRYIQAIDAHTLTFGLGPAGTGKSFLAVAMAVKALRDKLVTRIVLTRPIVEAGESLGYLPGDFMAKVDPYFRPLYDAMNELLEAERFAKLQERGVVEIAPLAYMRGRTLNEAFIILDEAQNTTPEQMKMFLTRIGFGSKAVVTGDVTQIDLPRGHSSGLIEAQHILSAVRGISFTYFTAADVVRHPLVARIVEAYEAAEEAEPPTPRTTRGARRADA